MAIAATRASLELRIDASLVDGTPESNAARGDHHVGYRGVVSALYFAYGSNLSPARMRERIAAAEPLGAARLAGFCLRLDKRGADGSGKANLCADPEREVWGALYRFDASEWPRLDAFEPGYERIEVEVVCLGSARAAHTYLSRRLTPDPVPFAWYKRLLVEGARAHGLPEEWVRTLEALPERTDVP
jgi:gamma-glutamylcyclotransferase